MQISGETNEWILFFYKLFWLIWNKFLQNLKKLGKTIMQNYAELCKFMQIFGEIIECIEFQIYFNYFIRIYVKLIHRIFMQIYGN